jgi:hypothetical protein
MRSPIEFIGIAPLEEFQEEDVLGPRVVRHQDDVVVVFDNPSKGREMFPRDQPPEGEAVQFAVTSKGFQSYAQTFVGEDQNSEEVIFRGSVVSERYHLPRYELKITL